MPSTSRRKNNWRLRREEALQRLGPGAGAIIAFLAIAIVGSLLSPTFLTQRNVTNVMRQTAMLGVVTVGMTFVILTAGIDLSVGMVLSFTSVAAAMLFDNGQGLPLPVVFLATLALGSVIGAFNGFMIIWRGAAPFVVTLAMMAIAGGAALTVSGGKPIGGIQGTYAWLGAGSVGPVPVLVLIMLAVFLLGALVLRYTPYGRHVYAVGGNEEASRLSGIAVDRVKVITYTISGLLSALGGIIFSARVTVGDPWAGRGLELDAIAAVVIGGTSLFGGVGTMWGSLLGALIITMINNVLNLLNVSPYMQGLAKGIIILAAITLYKNKEA
ncbi:MAG: ABC transporter permease [Bryobacterales bacterium]|nr:ABC transporter permease [Bryobacterales bacterium]